MNILKYLPAALRSLLTPKRYELFLSDQNEAFLGDGEKVGGRRLIDVVRDSQSSDPFGDAAAYQTFDYNGALVAGASAPAMGVRYTTTLSGVTLNVGFYGYKQDNTGNGAVKYVLYTRSTSGEPALRYEIDQAAVHKFYGTVRTNDVDQLQFGDSGLSLGRKPGATTTLLMDLVNQRNFEVKANGATIAIFRWQGRIEVAAEKEITFGNDFLRMKSKVGDPLTLQIDAVNARNIEMLTNNQVRILIKGNGDVLIPNAPVYASNASAISAGKTAGTVYRTATGEMRIVY